VGGGHENDATADYATVGGGQRNLANAEYATVGGGYINDATANYATVGGGGWNEASADYATVGGGYINLATADFATIAGGGPSILGSPDKFYTRNRVTDDYGTIGGGGNNQAGNDAGTTEDATYATVCGGEGNMALGNYAIVGGGYSNKADGQYATVPGGYLNEVEGDYSFAAGHRAKATYNGCFVWGDHTSGDIETTGHNQFKVRAKGGTWFYSNYSCTNGVRLESYGTEWIGFTSSDKALKHNIRRVDGKEILSKLVQVPISRWSFKADPPRIEHIGPMAQDFYAAFGLGDDDKSISTVDPDGVALAAIQGLYELVKEKDAEIAELRDRLAALEAVVLSEED
jgi:hypothetical protein